MEESVVDIRDETLALYSKLAFYPIHWEAFKYLCIHYRVRGTVIANTPPNLPTVHQQLGWGDPQADAHDGFSADIRFMPEADRGTKARWLRRELRSIRPDAIWVQEEPTDYFLLHILRTYFFNRRPRIVTAVCENVFSQGSLRDWLVRRLLWSRLDGLLAVATPSIEGIREVGMPTKVPAMTLVAGALPPPENVDPMPLPFARTEEDFVVAFAGRVVEQKGWKVLLAALTLLPRSFKCIIAGDGEQVAELLLWLSTPALKGRTSYMGLLPKDRLWSFYRAADCLVLPSINVPYPKEQFGGVLADGMAMGLPLLGSKVGGIPDTIGPAGLVVPDSKPDALASAIRRLGEDPDLRRQLGEAGQQRFWEEFAIPAYARKIAEALQLKECCGSLS